jgi:hypothetical protein
MRLQLLQTLKNKKDASFVGCTVDHIFVTQSRRTVNHSLVAQSTTVSSRSQQQSRCTVSMHSLVPQSTTVNRSLDAQSTTAKNIYSQKMGP